jgi:hypothetical protein
MMRLLAALAPQHWLQWQCLKMAEFKIGGVKVFLIVVVRSTGSTSEYYRPILNTFKKGNVQGREYRLYCLLNNFAEIGICQHKMYSVRTKVRGFLCIVNAILSLVAGRTHG